MMTLLMTPMAYKPPAMSPARVIVIEPSFSNVFWMSPSTVSMDTSHCIRSDDTQMWVTANMARGTKAGQAGHWGRDDEGIFLI